MSDEIDRSKEPVFGVEAKTAEKLEPGVRVVSRKVKSPDVEKAETPVRKKASTRKKAKKIPATNPTVPSVSVDEAAKLNVESSDVPKDSHNNNNRTDEDLAVSSLSESLVSTVRAMEENGSRLYEQERKFIDSLSEFQELKESQQKASTIVLISSVSAMLVSILFLIYAITSFSTKNEIFNSVSTALGTRIIEMNGGLATFEEARSQLSILQDRIEGLEFQIEGLGLQVKESQVGYINTEQDIQGQLLIYTQEINKEIIDQTANVRENLARLDNRFSAFNAQILDFGDALEKSEITLGEIGSEARSLNEMKEIMEALLTLEKERYYEKITGTSTGNQNAISNEGALPANEIPTFNRRSTQ